MQFCSKCYARIQEHTLFGFVLGMFELVFYARAGTFFRHVLAESRRQRHAPAEHAPQEQPLKEHALQEGARPVEPTYTLWATSLLVFPTTVRFWVFN